MKVALHACCGPCLLEPFDAIDAEAERVVVVYANPNIHPAEEYQRRRDTLREYAEANAIEVVELEYDREVWDERVGIHGSDRELRCRACYRMRMGLVSSWAAENGFEYVATTLTVSPYQDAEAIIEESIDAATAAGVCYLVRDYRERYEDATKRSRELGMYRQNYCGCVYSEAEAREDRERRRAERKRKKEAG